MLYAKLSKNFYCLKKNNNMKCQRTTDIPNVYQYKRNILNTKLIVVSLLWIEYGL